MANPPETPRPEAGPPIKDAAPAGKTIPAGPPAAKKAPLPSRNIMILAGVGVVLAIIVAFLLNRPIRPQPPAFQPAANPYAQAIFANGMIESDQTSGENLNIFPEVSGPVVATLVREGQTVRAGQPLFAIDDSVQRATTEQARLQAQAARALLAELKAEPRRETLAIAVSQLDQARANLKTLADQRDKLQRSAQLDPRSVSREALDSAIDAAKAGETAVEVAQRQLDLTKAGAWTYDIQNQAAQYAALSHAYDSAKALLGKYVVKAPADGVVLALNAAKGGYVSPQGTYDSYTQTSLPAAVLGPGAGTLAVRCYVDEILLSRLPRGRTIQAQMSVRGANVKVPLEFVRIQPYVTPKIELSNERQEQVDLRVLPVIFRFRTDPKIKLYPGEEVDVYISE
jgi:HlyD family secretion protein